MRAIMFYHQDILLSYFHSNYVLQTTTKFYRCLIKDLSEIFASIGMLTSISKYLFYQVFR